MIKYRLICDKEHEFDTWFANSAAFDKQKAGAFLQCPICDSKEVTRAIMAPAVVKKSNQKTSAATVDKVLAQMTQHVEKNFDYVGDDFAEEARKIHYGEVDTRDIYGETTIGEAKQLVEEGVPIGPLPGPLKQNKH